MDVFFSSALHIVTPIPFMWCVLGVALGIVVGAIPGLSGAMLITMTVPLTFFMGDFHDALILLVSMYVGSVSGGLISATLLRMPGTPAAVMTTLDGYPMARSGQAGRALGLGIMASFAGGLVSWLFLVILSPMLAIWATKFGPWEYFAMVAMALVLIASVSSGSMLKGLLAGFLGIIASMPGVDESTGRLRLTFGFDEWSNGLTLLPVLLGIFVISQVLKYVVDIDAKSEAISASTKNMLMSLKDWKDQAVNIIRSSLIGTWVGILPGIGASIGSICAYSVARNVSKTPEKFGTGFEDGIIASETANNATVGGALVPLVTMGIPGSVIDAILISALLMHNLQPGPLLFVTEPEIPYTIIATHLIANVVMVVLMLVSVKWIARLVQVPTAYLMPVILMVLHRRLFLDAEPGIRHVGRHRLRRPGLRDGEGPHPARALRHRLHPGRPGGKHAAVRADGLGGINRTALHPAHLGHVPGDHGASAGLVDRDRDSHHPPALGPVNRAPPWRPAPQEKNRRQCLGPED